MKTYDWLIVGGGITGAALSYELASLGCSVLLLEQHTTSVNATRYSYGGVAYWSATTTLMRQLCEEGIAYHRQLSEQLGHDTEFREVDLLLTIDAGRNPEPVAASYANVVIPPVLISADGAYELEPSLNREAIAAALQVKHGNVNPELTVHAYNQAFCRAGGEMQIATVIDFMRTGSTINGVVTTIGNLSAANVVVCAGGLSRALLRSAQLPVRIYYTQAELIETPSVDRQLRTMIMPAELKRFAVEATAGDAQTDALWDQPGHEIAPPILDAGVVQFQDGRMRIGQISRTLTDPYAVVDAKQSEIEMRRAVGRLLPQIAELPGDWRTCLVAFSSDRLPLIGTLPGVEGLHIFSGFSNPFVLLPPLARRFAGHVTKQADPLMEQFSPQRFSPD